MKLIVIILSIVAFATARIIKDPLPEFASPFGYLFKFGVPEAKRIQEAEEKYLRNQARIFNGSPAELGQFKYQAGLIGEFEDSPSRSACGGVLVSETSVLTAAHCWYDGVNQVSRLTVVLGSVLLFSGGYRDQTSDVVTHPLWVPLLIRNDIAAIRLSSPVQYSDFIEPVALPSGIQIFDSFAGEEAVASGFGITSSGGGLEDGQSLNYGQMTIHENSQCLNFFPGLVFSDSNICTRTLGSSSTCAGDSGGPLVVQRNGKPLLVGLTSFGLRWCTVGYPAAFVRVTSFLAFIHLNL